MDYSTGYILHVENGTKGNAPTANVLGAQLVERGLSKCLDEGLHISEVVTDAIMTTLLHAFIVLPGAAALHLHQYGSLPKKP